MDPMPGGNPSHDITRIVAGAIFDDEARLLLLHRNTPDRVEWEVPGGKYALGQDATACLVRELAEELGIVAITKEEIGCGLVVRNGRSFDCTLFRVEIVAGIPAPMERRLHDSVNYFDVRDTSLRPDLSDIARFLLQLLLKSTKTEIRSFRK